MFNFRHFIYQLNCFTSGPILIFGSTILSFILYLMEAIVVLVLIIDLTLPNPFDLNYHIISFFIRIINI